MTATSVAQDESGGQSESGQSETPQPDQNEATPASSAPPEQSAPTNYSEAIENQQKWTRELRELSQPLLEGDYEAEYKKVQSAYNSILSNGGNLSGGKDLETVQRALQLRVWRAADPAIQQVPQSMKDVLEQVRRELSRAGGAITNAQAKERFRQDYCRELFNVLGKLLENNWEARSFALSLLPDLEVTGAGFNSRRIQVYEPVAGLLADVVTDGKNHPDSIHQRAAAEIARFLKKTDSPALVQMKLASALASEMARMDTEIAYQLELVRALSEVTAARQVVGRPIPTAMMALVNVLGDDARHILVRCEAAKGTGRAGFDPQINFEPIAWKVVQLSVRTGVIYNQNQNQQLDWVFSLCGADLYFAFHHEDDDFRSGPNPQGFLNRAPRSQLVNDAYQQILKAAPAMWFGDRIANAELVGVNNWVNANVPANLTWDPNAPPVSK